MSAPRRAWPRPGRAADVLLAVALALAAVGGALAVWRPAPHVPVVPNAIAPAPASPATALTADAALQETVVRTNVFSATRTPPRARYVPPEAAADVPSFDTASASDLAPQPAAAQRGPDDAPRFYGTIMGPGGARALLRLDDRVPGAQLYAEGAREGGWRVVRVEPERVVLSGAGGRVTLRLPRPGHRRAEGAPARPTDSLDTPRTP